MSTWDATSNPDCKLDFVYIGTTFDRMIAVDFSPGGTQLVAIGELRDPELWDPNLTSPFAEIFIIVMDRYSPNTVRGIY